MAQLTNGGRLFIVALIGLAVFGGIYLYKDSGIFPKSVRESKVVAVEDLPPLDFDKNFATAVKLPLPGSDVTALKDTEIRAGIMGWNAQTGVMFANGGPLTTEGSLMEQNGVKLHLLTQNNCNEQAKGLYSFIEDYAAGKNRSAKGYHMIAWMGDGVPAYLADLNAQIKKAFGEEDIVQVFYAAGSSYGEDKFMAFPEAKANPQLLKGAVIVGVIRDGDWNIAMKFCSDNNIPVNNDFTTYDPDALNWISTDDYVKAAEIYVSNQGEKRQIVRNGKTTKRDTLIYPTGLVTWTPGDRVAVEKRGGLVTLASTKDYSSQMPNAWLASKKWMADNSSKVEGFILAAAQGGDQVKSHGSALAFASTVSAVVYGDNNMKAEDWERAFKGYTLTDTRGNRVEIGGSRTWNLADAAEYFGLNGTTNNYAAVYKTFGDIDVEAYPDVVPTYPPLNEVLNLSYLTNVYTANKNKTEIAGAASLPSFKASDKISAIVSNKSVSIEFLTGSAEISPRSEAILEKINNSAVIASNLKVEINGHTDNTGSAAINDELSAARAESVKRWLLSKDRSMYLNRITTNGFGSKNPVADNGTESGRQKNRRVEIILGN